MSDQLTPDLEAQLDAWLANREPTVIPVSFVDRIAGIPRSPASARRPGLALVPVTGRRSPSGLLAAAVVAAALAILVGGPFLAAFQRDKGVTSSASRSTSPSTSASASPGPATFEPVTPPPTSAAVWPSDFRSDGVLPAALADGVDHGMIDTPIGRARWVHVTGDAKSLPDPLVPILAPDGTLVWFGGGGPSVACYNDPKSATCADPPSPGLWVSKDALAPREARRLPIDVPDANLWLSGGTFWFTSSDPQTVWSSPDLETWQQTDLSGLRSPGPASIDWRMTISPSESVGGSAVASVEYTAADPGSLLGYPGRQVGLAQSGGGYVAREYRRMGDGGPKDLGAITVRKTTDGIRFMAGDGREVGRVAGVGLEFVDTWVRQGGLTYRQLAVLDGKRWSPVDLPVAPLADWPNLVKVGDAMLAFVVEPDQRVRAWRTVDGRTWTGGDVLVASDGTPMRSSGVTYRDGENGRVLIVFGGDDSSGWQSTDGEHWTPASFISGEILGARIAQGWFQTGDQTADGSWQVSSDGSTWKSVPALHAVIDKTQPLGGGGSSTSVVGNTVFFSVDEAEAPFSRDVWMIEFEQPAP